MANNPFSTCPHCGDSWTTRDEFLADPSLRVIAYDSNIKSLPDGELEFLHRVDGCDKKFTMRIGEFMDLYRGIRHKDNLALTTNCPRKCMDRNDLGRCSEKCRCAAGRETAIVVVCSQKADRRTAIFKGQSMLGVR
ncbi:MAG TPA: hypothetical protein VGK19_01695 [Capsulimonadaceae bacterium]|jgi:hypothetical protein